MNAHRVVERYPCTIVATLLIIALICTLWANGVGL